MTSRQIVVGYDGSESSRVASGFRANALSSAGAEGVAQFLPGTWTTWGRVEDGDGVADPWDPADAIPADARML